MLPIVTVSLFWKRWGISVLVDCFRYLKRQPMILVNFQPPNHYETSLSILELKMEEYSSLVIIWRAFSILAKSVTSPQTKKESP